MILADHEIRQAIQTGELKIEPFQPEMVKPGSYVMTLGTKIFRPRPTQVIDGRDPKVEYEEIIIDPNVGYGLEPGEFVLAQTAEKVSLSNAVAGMSDVRSTLARLGIQVILSSSFIEPGQKESFETLEIKHHGNSPVLLFPGMKIMKVVFVRLSSPAQVGYAESPDSSYAYQTEPNPQE